MLNTVKQLNGSLNGVQQIHGNLNSDVKNGLSAYQIARINGFTGTEKEWLLSLKGKDATINGLSTIEIIEGNNITIEQNDNKLKINGSDLTNYALKTEIPDNISDLNNDVGYLTDIPNTYKTKAENDELYQPKGNYLTSYTETDPTVPSYVKSITEQNITSWNNKSDFSGSYNDLTGKPTIPSKTSDLTNDSDFTTKSYVDNEISTYSETDPTVPSHVKSITEQNITNWNGKIEIIELLTVSDTAPTECATGDMYYNTTTNKIYTATNTDTWGETGTDPESSNLYIDLENTNIYYYDGTSFKSYGGGSGSGGDTEPIGSTKMYFGTTEPTGYKFVNGQALSRTEYAELFNLIGTTYGAGDESTTFNLPDMSGRVPVGLNVNKEWFNQLGKTGGSEEVTLTVEQMPNHNHIIGYDVRKNAETFTDSYSLGTTSGGDIKENSIPTTYVGGGQAHTNLQPYITVNYIMKVKNVASENVIVPDNFPIGGEISYSANTLPDNSWVWSDTNYLISDYPELAALYDGIFDDDTTQDGYFKTPKKAGLVTVGLDPNDTDFNTIGKTIGEKEHTLTIDEMPKHSHTFDFDQTAGSNANAVKTGVQSTYGKSTSSVGGNQPHNNIQPSIVSRFIIKAKRIEPNMSTVIGANDTPNDKDVYSSNAVKEMFDNANNDTGWIDLPLKNNWAALGGNYATPQYRKINNQVFIRGLINNGTNTQIAQLPEGFRPLKLYMEFMSPMTLLKLCL